MGGSGASAPLPPPPPPPTATTARGRGWRPTHLRQLSSKGTEGRCNGWGVGGSNVDTFYDPIMCTYLDPEPAVHFFKMPDSYSCLYVRCISDSELGSRKILLSWGVNFSNYRYRYTWFIAKNFFLSLFLF